MSAPRNEGFQVITHDVLFEDAIDKSACDVCGEHVEEADDALTGHSYFMRARGEHVAYESRPLCERCATAVGMTALHRWQVEEEEG